MAPLHVCSMFTEVLTGMKYRVQMEATKKNYYLNAHSFGNRCESFAHWIIYIYWWSSHPPDWFMSKPHQYFCHLLAYPKYGQCTVPLRFNKERKKARNHQSKRTSALGKIVVCGFALALALWFALYFCPLIFALAPWVVLSLSLWMLCRRAFSSYHDFHFSDAGSAFKNWWWLRRWLA